MLWYNFDVERMISIKNLFVGVFVVLRYLLKQFGGEIGTVRKQFNSEYWQLSDCTNVINAYFIVNLGFKDELIPEMGSMSSVWRVNDNIFN